MRHKAVVFDLFGTLVDNMTHSAYLEIMGQMAHAVSIPRKPFSALWTGTTDDRFRGKLGTLEDNLKHICATAGVAPSPEGLARAVRVRTDLNLSLLVPRADAVETLTRLRASGRKIGLLTDCTPEIPLHWPRTPFAPLVDAPVFSSETGTKKPDPKIYALVCERLGVAPADCLYVGDGGSRELTGAAAVGMAPVLIRAQPVEDVLGHKSEAPTWTGPVVTSLSEVLAFVG